MKAKIFCLIIVTASVLFPLQQRKSIHQLESETHRWDDLRIPRGIPSFTTAKIYVLAGKQDSAIALFRSSARRNKSAAFFNIGLIYFYSGQNDSARQYLERSQKLRSHPATKRLLEEVERIDMQKKQ